MFAMINEAYSQPNNGHEDYAEAFVIEMNK